MVAPYSTADNRGGRAGWTKALQGHVSNVSLIDVATSARCTAATVACGEYWYALHSIRPPQRLP